MLKWAGHQYEPIGSGPRAQSEKHLRSVVRPVHLKHPIGQRRGAGRIGPAGGDVRGELRSIAERAAFSYTRTPREM